ncbi:GMC family oxidoreductase [Pseudonocardia xinjiangensis]|uniref:GMC family oxidoreductase n=1 Tax=Pseudonocardia xinjiangensis TaxID=75289 RepID=UPI003D940B1A
MSTNEDYDENYDYVIVGAGSAGCVVAHRLTENPDVRVLLLEAGGEDDNDAMRVPALFTSLFKSDADWNYEVEPREQVGVPARYWPRGKTLGGSSSINLMVYTRGNRVDYDEWSAAGASGWDFESVLPYFVKLESNSRLGAPLHGKDGPQHAEDRLFTHELSYAWVEAAVEWGLARNDDFNGESQSGAGLYQVTCHGGRRWSTADAYLRPASTRPNLTVRTGAHATRVLFDGVQARGVAYLSDGAERHARADREVVLSGGAVNSPQLLLLSGIGPADHLLQHGIDVTMDLPGVGENLQDHPMVPLAWATTGSTDLLDLATPENMQRWAEGGGGPFTSNGAEVGGFLSTQAGGDVPDVQFLGGPTGFINHGFTRPQVPVFTMVSALTRAHSRGRLRLRSADPLTHPHVDPGYYSDPADLPTMVSGLRASLEIVRHSPLAPFIDRPFLQPSDELDDSALANHARLWTQTEYHVVGTCAMGNEQLAAVDPSLRVRGVDGLRVIDASVMPLIPRANTNAPTIMIGEKGADLIKASW